MTATAIDSYPGTEARRREARLVRMLSRAGRLRSIGGEQWLFFAGAALVVAGLLCILVGWVGTSRTVLVAGQIPYLVSGGLLGLGLVFMGGFLYFGHWVAVLARENRESAAADRRDMAALRASISELAGAIRDTVAASATVAQLPARSDPPAASEHSAFTETPAGELPFAPSLVATASGGMMHRPDCAAVAGRTVRRVTIADGLRSCGICRPLEDRPHGLSVDRPHGLSVDRPHGLSV